MAYQSETVDKVFNFIKEYGEPLSVKEISDGSGVPFRYAQNMMPIVMSKYGKSIKRTEGKRTKGGKPPYVYSYNPDGEKLDTPMRNSEGYIDPTAGKAIMSLEKKSNGGYPMRCSIGDVWETERGSNVLVIAMIPETNSVVAVSLLNEKRPFMKEGSFVLFTAGLSNYYASVMNIVSFKESNLQTKLGRINGEMESFRKIFTEVFKGVINSVIEKEVEVVKEVEVPVEVEKEVPPKDENLEIALLRQKVEIYEKLIFEKNNFVGGNR